MNKPKILAIALLITAAATLPLKAAEQCCQPCPNGVLVGVTADSCGACMDLAKFIPGCTSADTSGCTACETGYTLANGKCISTAAVSVNGLHCPSQKFVTGSKKVDGGTNNTYGYTYTFIPNCLECDIAAMAGHARCKTCTLGTGHYCK